MLEMKKLIFITALLALTAVFLSTGFVGAAETYPQADLNPPLFTSHVAVVIFLIVLVLVLFIWEPLPIGIIAISIPVILIALKSWTKVSAEQALSGFSNNATVTVMAMFVISRGIQNSGAVENFRQ